MRRTFSVLILAACSILSACNNDKKQITEAATGYLTAMANYRQQEAVPFATQETIDTYIAFINQYLAPQYDTNATLRANCEAEMPASISINNIEIIDDTTAIVTYTKETPRSRATNQELAMRKRNNQWKAHFPLDEVPSLFQATKNNKLSIDEMKKRNFRTVSADSMLSAQKNTQLSLQ